MYLAAKRVICSLTSRRREGRVAFYGKSFRLPSFGSMQTVYLHCEDSPYIPPGSRRKAISRPRASQLGPPCRSSHLGGVCAFVPACDRSEGDELANRFVYKFPCCDHDFFPLPFSWKPGVEISRLSIRNTEIALGNVEGGKKRPTLPAGRNVGLPHSRDRVLATYKHIEIRRTSPRKNGAPHRKSRDEDC